MLNRFEAEVCNRTNTKKNEIQLSIIVPIYNAEKYLEKCIRSILTNDLREIEIILINDGSTDNSDRVCREYETKFPNNIKYILKTNTGCSETRNFGIEHSRGKYISFIDSDDFIEDGSYSEILKKTINEDLIVFGIENIYNEKKEKFSLKKDTNLENLKSETHLFASPVNKFYKTQILKENNILFPPNSHCGEDLAFNMKYICYVKNIRVIEKCYYKYLLHGENSIYSLEKKKDIFNSLRDILIFYQDKGIDINYAFEKFKIYCVKYPFVMLEGASKDDFIKYRKVFFKESLKINKEYFNDTFFGKLYIYTYLLIACILWRIKISRLIITVLKKFNRRIFVKCIKT